MPLIPLNREHGWAPYVWLIFLAFYFFQPVLDHAGAREWIITLASTAVFVTLYFTIFWTKPPLTYALLIGMAGMGLAFSRFNQGASVFIIFTSTFIPWVFGSSRRALLALGALITALAIDAVFFHAPVGFWATSMVVALGVSGSNIHFAEKNRADVKLRMAHEEIEHLAKVAERERIARDLHDVLGHTLSLIIVKSAVASKVMDKYPQKAKDALADIESVSRKAMAEIRSTLRGYSSYKLDEEFERAKSTLKTAGVEVRAESAEIKMSAGQESVLALLTREAVTNVVRHAHARHCSLQLGANNGSCVLEIQDDGRGGNHIEGNGLRGMRERIEALGGSLLLDGSAGTRLRFEFPLEATNGKH